MPVEGWNGKYRQAGNGGWAGSIAVQPLAHAVRLGYATAATDDGHEGGASAAWAIGHPEKLIDFGYRAVHETSVQAKAIVRAFYGTDPARTYFVGCSDGGREALMEAQRYPEDFDGIIAGAPANYWSHHFTGFVWNDRLCWRNRKRHPSRETARHSECRSRRLRRTRRRKGRPDRRPAHLPLRPRRARLQRRRFARLPHRPANGSAAQDLRRAQESAHRRTDLPRLSRPAPKAAARGWAALDHAADRRTPRPVPASATRITARRFSKTRSGTSAT